MDAVAQIIRMRRLDESAYLDEGDTGYVVNKINNNKFEVVKDASTTYVLEKKQSRWHCSCRGFQHRSKCKHLDMIKDHLPKRHERAVITNAVKDILPKLKAITPRVEIVGSYRRGTKDSKDIDILMDCSAAEFKKVVDILQGYANYTPVMAGESIIRGFCDGIEMDINRLAEGMNYYLALEYRTGPYEHNIAMRALAKKLKGSLSENELVVMGRNIRVTSEKDIYDALGVEYQDPKNRSENLVLTKITKTESYRATVNGKSLGSAPSRAYAKHQVKDIREMCRQLANLLKKELDDISPIQMTLEKPEVEFRVTVSEEEIPCQAKYKVVTPLGDEVPTFCYKLLLKPVLKLDGKRVRMGEKIDYNGKQMMLHELMMKLVQREIDHRLKLPTHAVGKLCSNDLGTAGLPELLEFRTVAFPVEGVKG